MAHQKVQILQSEAEVILSSRPMRREKNPDFLVDLDIKVINVQQL